MKDPQAIINIVQMLGYSKLPQFHPHWGGTAIGYHESAFVKEITKDCCYRLEVSNNQEYGIVELWTPKFKITSHQPIRLANGKGIWEEERRCLAVYHINHQTLEKELSEEIAAQWILLMRLSSDESAWDSEPRKRLSNLIHDLEWITKTKLPLEAHNFGWKAASLLATTTTTSETQRKALPPPLDPPETYTAD